MFETTKPISPAQAARFSEGGADGADHADAGKTVRNGDTLRRIEWSDLTARLKAARDYRLILRSDANSGNRASNGGLADAAERFFRAKNKSEQAVNPVALGGSKGSPGMIAKDREHPADGSRVRGHAVTGVARDDK